LGEIEIEIGNRVRVVERGADLDGRRVLVGRARLGDDGIDEKVASLGEVLGHSPHHCSSLAGRCVAPDAGVKLRRAEAIACSICAVDAVSTSAIVASVAGFSTRSVGPSPATYLPSMNG